MLILFKFIVGILLVQLTTVALVMLMPDGLEGIGVLRLIIPLLVVGVAVALWFASMTQHYRQDQVSKAKEDFAKQREKLILNAERSKARVVKQAHKDVVKEARTAHAKANFKVGASFAAAIGVGGLLLLTQFLTIGLLLVSTSGGALAGYLYKARRQSRANLLDSNAQPSTRLVNAAPTKRLLDKLRK